MIFKKWKNKLIAMIEFLKLKQGFLFYIYNLVIPLIIPFFILLILILQFTRMKVSFILPQIFLYNTVVLSTNVGLLNKISAIKDNFKSINIASSLCLIIINIFLFIDSFIITFGNYDLKTTSLIFYTIFAIFLVYLSVLLLSKNKEATFYQEPDVYLLADSREKKDKELSEKILRGGENDR